VGVTSDDLPFFGSLPFEETVFQARPPTPLEEIRARLDALEARHPLARRPGRHAPVLPDDQQTADLRRAVHERARALGMQVKP
jgi:hypothetical protein